MSVPQVTEGRYIDEADVIRDAVRHFQAQSPESLNIVDLDVLDAVARMMMELAENGQEDLKSMLVLMEATQVAKKQMRELIDRLARDVAANADEAARNAPLDFSKGLRSEEMVHHVGMPTLDVEVPGGVRLVTADLWPGEITTVDQLDAIINRARADLDCLNATGNEMAMMKIQSAISARGQFLSIVSNMHKALSDSARRIAQKIQ